MIPGEPVQSLFDFLGPRLSQNARHDVAFGIDALGALAIQSDGKIITGGIGGYNFPGGTHWDLERFNPDGSLDPSFGKAGLVELPDPSGYQLSAAVVAPSTTPPCSGECSTTISPISSPFTLSS